MRYHKEKSFAKLIIITSLLAIVLSTFIMTSVLGVLGLSKHEDAKFWLFAAWCLWGIAILIGLAIMLISTPEKVEPEPAPAPSAEGEESEATPVMTVPATSWNLKRILSIAMGVCFGAGVISMLIFYAYMMLPKLNTGLTG